MDEYGTCKIYAEKADGLFKITTWLKLAGVRRHYRLGQRWARRASLRLDAGRGGFQPLRLRGEADFTRISGGLNDDLREAVERAARPHLAGGFARKFHVHVGLEAAAARFIQHSHGNDIVTHVQGGADIERRRG